MEEAPIQVHRIKEEYGEYRPWFPLTLDDVPNSDDDEVCIELYNCIATKDKK